MNVVDRREGEGQGFFGFLCDSCMQSCNCRLGTGALQLCSLIDERNKKNPFLSAAALPCPPVPVQCLLVVLGPPGMTELPPDPS